MIIGDFIFHLETTCSNLRTFHSLIESFDLNQNINFPTHIHGHTLDLVLTKSNNDNISNVHTTDAFSHLFSISFTLNLSIPRTQINANVTFLKYHKIGREKVKKIWSLLAKLLPLINPPQLLAERFVEFFTEKIEKIRSTYTTSVNSQHITQDSPTPMFSTSSTVTEDQVAKIIMNSSSKSCSLDPRPTLLVLHYLDNLITPITLIINASLEQGKCSNFFKQAHVTLIIKKSSSDKEVFKKNYRPVSNLNFISKILESLEEVQLQTHLDEAGLMTAFQSAYRKHHYTESALLNIQHD